jgi:hypothetical protein
MKFIDILPGFLAVGVLAVPITKREADTKPVIVKCLTMEEICQLQ